MIRFGTTLVAAFAAAGFAVGCATTTTGPSATTARMHGPADAVIHISGLS